MHPSTHLRPITELLEGRTLLSSVVINSTLDQVDAASSKTVTLRDAINAANSSATPTTITFDSKVFSAAKTIVVSNGELGLTNTSASTTIIGPAAPLKIDGLNTHSTGNNFRISPGVTVSMSQLTLARGAIDNAGNLHINQVTVSGLVYQPNSFGGGIGNRAGGILVASNSVISANTLDNGTGGGLWNAGTATLTDVTISGNTASVNGGGIFNSGKLTFTRGTISGNNTTQNDNGGGVYNSGTATFTNVTIANSLAGGGINNSGGTTVLSNVTISGNHARNNGGGIFVQGGTLTLANTIVAGNTSGLGGPDAFGAVHSRGHNLVGKSDGSSGWIAADSVGTAAKPLASKLAALANNGGPTQTMLPLTGSPAIDHGSNALIPTGITTDQRGLPRAYNGTVDIGAMEAQPSIQITAPAKQSATTSASVNVMLGSYVQFSNSGPFKLDINWGDGSSDTILTLATAGTIPAAAHKFVKVGSLTVSETITDAKSNKSNTATFTDVVTGALGSISGKVFDDANGDGKIDNGEFGVGLWNVYLDLNKNGKLDTGDKSVTTDINGNWSFAALTAGTYVVRVVPVAGTVATKPAGNVATITLTAGQVSIGNLFGEKATA